MRIFCRFTYIFILLLNIMVFNMSSFALAEDKNNTLYNGRTREEIFDSLRAGYDAIIRNISSYPQVAPAYSGLRGASNDALKSPNNALLHPNDANARPNDATLQPNDATVNPNNALLRPNDATRYPNTTASNP